VRLAQEGDLAMLLGRGRRRAIFKLKAGKSYHTHHGIIEHAELIGARWGSIVETHLGTPFILLEPSLHDLLLHIRRKSQIIFPKDIGYILLQLSVGPGKRVLEAGTGSGALTTALAWMVGESGEVISYDRRADMHELARRNLSRLGLEGRVTFRLRDLSEGLIDQDVDAIFLDLPRPEASLAHVAQALTNGGVLGCILPTANQVSTLLEAMEAQGFGAIEVVEILLRGYKPVSERLRPFDRMVAHTGYLLFARLLEGALPE